MSLAQQTSPAIGRPQSASASDAWEAQLEDISKVLYGAQSALDGLHEQHFGTSPADSTGASVSTVPNGRADRIARLINRMGEQAEQLRQSAQSLNARI